MSMAAAATAKCSGSCVEATMENHGVHVVLLQHEAEQEKTRAAVVGIVFQQCAVDFFRFLGMAELFLRECEKLPGLGVFGIFLHGDFKLTSGVGKAAGYVQRLRVGEAYLRRQLLFGDLTEHLHGFLRLGATQKREGQLRLCLTVAGCLPAKLRSRLMASFFCCSG